jgi:3-dehydroquinate synthase
MTVETTYSFEFDSEVASLLNGKSASGRGSSIVLTGIMGSGKTAVGAHLAKQLGLPFHDTDALIEARTGQKISTIFSEQGEPEFRALEHEALKRACSGEPAVIATGGGAVLSVENRALMRNAGVVVWLRAARSALANRLVSDGTRPLLADSSDPAEEALKLESARINAYQSAADFQINTSKLSPMDAAAKIAATVRRLRPSGPDRTLAPTRLHMELGDRSYPLFLGTGIVKGVAGQIIQQCGRPNRVCIVTHPGLAGPYAAPIAQQLEALGIRCYIETVPPGERYKNLQTISRFYSAFVRARLDRKSMVAAIGGGVIGDMAGFAAASFLRGIAFFQIPTTLLSQVDSSIGGKTGVDLPEGKNLVGAFHQPKGVVLDTETLDTLPLRELRSGLAEVIKYGIISDSSFFYQTQDNLQPILQRKPEALAPAIARSCEIKGAVVSADETEQGLRAILNFGHTVGHALETATRYRRYRHGEAISIGMVSACLIGEELGITPSNVTAEVTQCLKQAGLPTEFPEDIDLQEIHRGMLLDKKTVSGKLKFVLVETIGTVRIVSDVDPAVVNSALQRYNRA